MLLASLSTGAPPAAACNKGDGGERRGVTKFPRKNTYFPQLSLRPLPLYSEFNRQHRRDWWRAAPSNRARLQVVGPYSRQDVGHLRSCAPRLARYRGAYSYPGHRIRSARGPGRTGRVTGRDIRRSGPTGWTSARVAANLLHLPQMTIFTMPTKQPISSDAGHNSSEPLTK